MAKSKVIQPSHEQQEKNLKVKAPSLVVKKYAKVVFLRVPQRIVNFIELNTETREEKNQLFESMFEAYCNAFEIDVNNDGTFQVRNQLQLFDDSGNPSVV